MPKDTDVNTFSIDDIIDAYARYDASPEVKEPILYFVSELTGLSVETIMNKAS